MTTKLTQRDKSLLLILLGALVFFAVYMTVCKDYDARTQAAEARLAELTPRLQQLQEYEANKKTYEAKTVKMRDEIATQMERYPTDLRSEHIINNATTLQDSLGIKVMSIGADPAALLSSFQLPLRDESGQYVMQNVYAFSTGENIQCSMNYDQFKSLIDFIYSRKERTALKSISVTYDSETGILSGAASLVKFFIVPEKYVYEKEYIDGVKQGVTNPFGTLAPGKAKTSGADNADTNGTNANSNANTNSTNTSGGVTEIRPSPSNN